MPSSSLSLAHLNAPNTPQFRAFESWVERTNAPYGRLRPLRLSQTRAREIISSLVNPASKAAGLRCLDFFDHPAAVHCKLWGCDGFLFEPNVYLYGHDQYQAPITAREAMHSLALATGLDIVSIDRSEGFYSSHCIPFIVRVPRAHELCRLERMSKDASAPLVSAAYRHSNTGLAMTMT